LGLKENVIIGHLIPAGTGLERHRNIYLKEKKKEEVGESIEIFEESA